MKLIVGLGNPGEKYKNVRHNTGFLVVDVLQKTKLPKDVIVKKSDVFMNDSGSFAAKLIKNYKLETKNLVIVHDDLDIPLGSFKIQFGRGPKDHNGIKSVDDALGTNEYWRVRVGIENRPQESKPSGEVYTLEDFTKDERIILDKTINEICKKLATSLINTN